MINTLAPCSFLGLYSPGGAFSHSWVIAFLQNFDAHPHDKCMAEPSQGVVSVIPGVE